MHALTTAQIIERIAAWQSAAFVHPLTCYDSSHPLLVAEVQKHDWGEEVVLKCPKCGNISKVPPSILTISPEEMKAEKERLNAMGFKFEKKPLF